MASRIVNQSQSQETSNEIALICERNQITARIVGEVGLGDTAGFIAHAEFAKLMELHRQLEAVRS